MGREPRICVHIEGAIYYVTARVDSAPEIFKDDEDYKAYEELLDKYKAQYGFQLFSYVLMPSHLHILVALPEGVTISQIMHSLNSSYIKYFNRRYGRKGHLLTERFDLIVAEKQSNLLSLSAYIHLNPCRQGLVKAPQDYAHSSYRHCMEGALQNEGRELIEILSQTTDYKKYEDFVENIPEEEMRVLGEKLKKAKILGSQAFKEKVKGMVEVQAKLQAEAQKPEMNKKLVLAGALIVFALGVMAVSLYVVNLGLKSDYQTTLQIKEEELEENIKAAKEKVRKGLQERYEADMVSYAAMARRLGLEKEGRKRRN